MTCICVEPEECSECSKDAEISMLRAEIDHLRKLLKMAEDELIESDNHGRAQEKRADALEAENETLEEALLQTIVDINDTHPRNSTLEGYRKAMQATEKMIRSVLERRSRELRNL